MIERFRHTLATGEPYHSPRSIELRQDTGQVESYDWTIERITMPDGRPGVVCNFYDLSERQQYEEHIGLLMREVNHRAKNLLTVVMSIARQTARDCTPEEFLDRFSRRLLGLAASQDLIVQGNWGGVTMEDLVRSQLRNLGHEVSDSRFEIDGPSMMLAPSAAQGIGMALHELGTNAIKYGALCVPEGIVAIRWGVSEDGRDYHIRWQERGGPVVEQPDRSGFGRVVIEQMAAISVGGRVELDYAPEGLVWMLEAPVERVAGGPGGAQLAVWGAKG
jgi:two-component sensor histidine kinase